MATASNYPVPFGVGFSQSNIPANTNSKTGYLPPGNAVVTFQPADVNNPGTLTVYTSGGTAVYTVQNAGYSTFTVPGETGVETAGASYYVSCTQPINQVALTVPSVWR